ncbi:hypothetical protein [Mucisphaera sp.]|uniref:hypothetical protein n=1 Tax=Mucisphaera sp. TaxID=2913024 RepID=UPI003D0AA619
MKRTMLAILLGGLSCSPALAESSLTGVLMPFAPDKQVEIEAQALAVFGSEIEQNGIDVSVRITDFEIRGLLQETEDLRSSLRFRFHGLGVDSSDPALPDGFVDVFFGGGNTYVLEDDWSLSWGLGVGYAGQSYDEDGDLSFDRDDGFYGAAGIAGTKQLDEFTSVTVLLDWDGNRSVFPDVPLPGILYTRRLQTEQPLVVTVGFPFTSVVWNPVERLRVEATFFFPESVEAEVTYLLTDEWDVFVSLGRQAESYATNALPEDRRLFFEQSRLEVGTNWRPEEEVEVSFGVGLAYNQEFTTGFDRRDDNTFRDLDDAPFIRAGLRLAF